MTGTATVRLHPPAGVLGPVNPACWLLGPHQTTPQVPSIPGCVLGWAIVPAAPCFPRRRDDPDEDIRCSDGYQSPC